MSRKLATEVDLECTQLTEKTPDSLKRDVNEIITQEDYIDAGSCCKVKVQVQGDVTSKKPAIFTFHDIGLNAMSTFGGYFNYPDMIPILKNFTIYHINAPGQEDGAALFSSNDTYPSMDKLAEMIWFIMQHYNVDRFIGFGSGLGGNILCRFALSHPDKVEGLILINCTASKAGWTEWAYQKMNIYHLCRGRLTDGVEEYLLWHWFGNKTVDTNYDLVTAYSAYIKNINPYNLGHLIDSYVKRTDLDIVREVLPSKKKAARMIRCPVMLVTSDHSPHLNDTVAMNARLDPTNSTWIKYDCGGLVLEEQPGKLTESLRLFLQGMGYVPSLRKTELAPRNFEFHYLPRGAASSSSSKKVDSNPASVYVIGNATKV